MDKQLYLEMKRYLGEIQDKYLVQTKRFEELQTVGYDKVTLKASKRKSGTVFYSAVSKSSDKKWYLGNDSSQEVNNIREARFLSVSTKELEREISIISRFLSQCRPNDYHAINKKLPAIYRGCKFESAKAADKRALQWKINMEAYKKTIPPFRPHELIHKTHDGTMVRSKGEAIIYNYLLELGVTFVYELPLKTKGRMFLPDFTILSEIDYTSVILIEHQGMMNDPKYRKKYNDSVYDYWLENYIPERDVFFTFDLPNGGFDDTPIKSIIRQYIRPELHCDHGNI